MPIIESRGLNNKAISHLFSLAIQFQKVLSAMQKHLNTCDNAVQPLFKWMAFQYEPRTYL
jgi:hypothetical protein